MILVRFDSLKKPRDVIARRVVPRDEGWQSQLCEKMTPYLCSGAVRFEEREMSSQAEKLKIGLFVVVSLSLAVGTIIWLGGVALF